MKLTVCCHTNDPGPRVRAVLNGVREIADEVVIAVDARVDPSMLGHYAAIADRLVRYDFAPPNERAIPWLHTLCSGDWILRLDGSEVLSPLTIRMLPKLIERTDVYQYWLPCRWLYPDAKHWIDQTPWNYFAPRMARNDPARTWVPGRSHAVVDPVFPSAYLSSGWYRTRCVVSPREEREERLRYYWAIPYEQRIEGIDPYLLPIYVPEAAPSLAPVPVPAEDQQAVDAVLNASGPELPTPSDLHVPLASREEVDRHWPERPLGPEAYRAELRIVDRDRRVQRGTPRIFRVRIRNLSEERWPGGERRPWIRVVHRWRDRDGSIVPVSPSGGGGQFAEGPRTSLPGPIAPNQTCVVPVEVTPPDRLGPLLLEIDLVHEFVRWFGCTVREALDVGEARSESHLVE